MKGGMGADKNQRHWCVTGVSAFGLFRPKADLPETAPFRSLAPENFNWQSRQSMRFVL